MTRWLIGLVVAGGLAATSACTLPESKTAGAMTAVVKAEPEPPVTSLITLRDAGLKELSGLAVSRRNQGLVWVARRGGDRPLLEGVSLEGVTITRLEVVGAERVEWVDLATGPGVDGRSAIFIADRTGTVYRVVEPRAPTGEDVEAASEVLEFRLSGGAPDCGAVLRDPLSDKLVLVARAAEGTSPVYVGDALAASGTVAELEPVAHVAYGGVVAGDVSADGMRIALRTATSVVEWRRDRGERVDKALERAPARVVTLRDPEAGTAAYGRDASLWIAVGAQVVRLEALGLGW